MSHLAKPPPATNMQGKRALVTGAAQGIGKAITEALLKRGAKVCLVDLQDDKGAETAKTFQNTYGKDSATFIKCDVSDPNQFADTFAQAKLIMGGLDIVVNNAGIADEKQWEKMLAINLVMNVGALVDSEAVPNEVKGEQVQIYGLSAVIRGTYLAVEHMSRDNKGQGGMIVNIASGAGLRTIPPIPSYAASKHGVVGFSSSIGENPIFTKQGIRINCLCPGFADTDMVNYTEEQVWGKEMLDEFKAAGLLSVSVVSEACLSLLDDQFLSGAVLRVSLKGREMVRPGIRVTDDK